MDNIQDILRVQGVKSKGYGIIAKLAMQDRRLSIEAKAIYAYFCSYAGAGSTAFPRVAKIIEDLGISENRFYKHFKLLKQYGYIIVEQIKKAGGQFSHNVYTLEENPEEITETDSKEDPQNRGTGIETPPLQYEGTDIQAPPPQNKGTEKEPSPQNEGAEVPSLRFPCTEKPSTENLGTNINSSLKLTSSFNNNNLSINQENNETSEGKIECNDNNDFQKILELAHLEYLHDSLLGDPLAVEQALRMLYFGTKPLKVRNMLIPPSQVRKDLQKISFDAIVAGFEDFKRESKVQPIKSPVAYLSVCIYNAIWNSTIQAIAQANYDLAHTHNSW